VVGVSAHSLDIARGIGERDGEAFSDRPKTDVRNNPGFDPPLSFGIKNHRRPVELRPVIKSTTLGARAANFFPHNVRNASASVTNIMR